MAGDPRPFQADPPRPTRSLSASSATSSVNTFPITESQSGSDLAASWTAEGGRIGADGDGDDVLLAVQALGLMRQGSDQGQAYPEQKPAVGHAGQGKQSSAGGAGASRSNSSASHRSLSWSTSRPTPSTTASSPSRASSQHDKNGLPNGELVIDEGDPKFIARVSALPIVSGGLEWYERSKASSRVVKYGAGLVESSLSTISRPLAGNLNQLDDFACRQLDRLGQRTSPPPADHEHEYALDQDDTVDLDEDPRLARERRGRSGAPQFRDAPSPQHQAQHQHDPSAGQGQSQGEGGAGADQQVAVATRSRWQTVLVEAGGLGAAVSEESLKSLRYCLQWLMYATAHLDHQITVLRDFILSLHRHPRPGGAEANALVHAQTAHLGQIKHDVVDTIRKVVDVVSKYAGAALPEQAKRYVRQSILGLPVKWASAIESGRAGGRGGESAGSTPVPERMGEGGEVEGGGAGGGAGVLDPVLRPTEEAAERVLTFAAESLDMLKGVTQTFGDSISSAEAWIERLRIVGLDRQRQRQAAQNAAGVNDAASVAGIKRPHPGHDSDSGGEGASTSALGGGVGAEGSEGVAGGARRRKGPRSRDNTAGVSGSATPAPMEVEP